MLGGRKAIVVAGPTASGKSALALRIAASCGGVVINADAMQLYDGLRILTARPTPADEAVVPHRLYGVVPPEQPCSAGGWRKLAAVELGAAWAAGRLPVVTGGTGLYLRALTEGLSPIPTVPAAIRAEANALLARAGNAGLHALLAERDPVMAARLHPGNSQRLVRAWEVLVATGRSLAAWQAEPLAGRVEADYLILVLAPPRAPLYAACDARLRAMVAIGAVAEVEALAARRLDPTVPAMKALGVPEFLAHLRGELALDAAIATAQQTTRHYAKRQLTWFRHQIAPSYSIPAQYLESSWEEIFPIIRRFLLTLPS